MSRELKFRIWNGAEMVYDVTVGRFGVFYVSPSNNGLDPKDSASLTPLTTKYHENTPVMQFTGLKDKNGVEIYEGDVLQFVGCLFEVRFDRGAFFGDPLATNDIRGHLSCQSFPDARVIGNIYQNPELLKK